MKIKESIQRLQWRFMDSVKKNKPFHINENDAEALNTLIEFYDKTSKDNYKNNELAFKMYLWHRIEMMKHYKEDILGVQSQKTIASALSKPVQSFIDRFTDFINENDIRVLIESVDSVKKPYFTLSESEKTNGVLKLEKMLKENPNLFTSAKWESHDVKENLVAEFNQLINIV